MAAATSTRSLPPASPRPPRSRPAPRTTSPSAKPRSCSLIALGHTNGEIADQLFLSIRTVETHRAHIQQKLRRSKRAELVRYALEKGLIEPDTTAS